MQHLTKLIAEDYCLCSFSPPSPLLKTQLLSPSRLIRLEVAHKGWTNSSSRRRRLVHLTQLPPARTHQGAFPRRATTAWTTQPVDSKLVLEHTEVSDFPALLRTVAQEAGTVNKARAPGLSLVVLPPREEDRLRSSLTKTLLQKVAVLDRKSVV